MKIASIENVVKKPIKSLKKSRKLHKNNHPKQVEKRPLKVVKQDTLPLRETLEKQAEMLTPEEYIRARSYIADLERMYYQ